MKFLRWGMLLVILGTAFELVRGPLPRPWKHAQLEHQPFVRQLGYPIIVRNIENTKSFTVLISIEGFEGIYRGTGVLIDSTTVLTCYHMVHSYDDDIWVYLYPANQVVKGHPILGDREHDLALLKLEHPIALRQYATFSTSTVAGEPITVVGNTLGAMRWFVSYGVVSAYDHGYILTDALIQDGNSGGPWINDKGQIVALTDWKLQNGDKDLGIGGGVASSNIQDFIESYRHPLNLLQMLMGAQSFYRKDLNDH